MGLFVKAEAEANYELPDAGTYTGVCIQVIDLGTHPNTHPKAKPGAKKREVMIIWELGELMEDGKPFCVNRRYTMSLGEKAKLRAHLESWRGKKFTEQELAGFDISTLIGVPATLGLVHSANGKYANVDAISPPMKGVEIKEPVNKKLLFAFGENEDTYNELWPWIRRIIAESEEGKAAGLSPEVNSDKQEEEGEDQIPF